MSTNRPDSQSDAPLFAILGELGAARAAGAFDGKATLPWQSRGGSVHRGLSWLRFSVPLAAAAMIAIAFVGTHLRHAPEVGSASWSQGSAASSQLVAANPDDDCNGDGVVNGDDIACFVRQNSVKGSVSALQAQALTRRLLGI